MRIQAASLNFPDLLIVQSKYQIKPPLPFVPGSEYAGVVEAVGEGVTGFKVGAAGGLPVGHRRLRHPHHWRRPRCACRCRPAFPPSMRRPSS